VKERSKKVHPNDELVRQFLSSNLAHESAHELLHKTWADERPDDRDDQPGLVENDNV